MPKVDEEEVNNFANLLREEKRSHLNFSLFRRLALIYFLISIQFPSIRDYLTQFSSTQPETILGTLNSIDDKP